MAPRNAMSRWKAASDRSIRADIRASVNLVQIVARFNFVDSLPSAARSPSAHWSCRTNQLRHPSARPAAARRSCDGALLAIDAVDDLVDLEGREHPVDRRPRRFHRITLAAEFVGDAPADLKARPPRRRPRPDAADITCRLDFSSTTNMPKPCSAQCPDHHGGVAPAADPVVTGLPSGVMKRAVPGSDSIAVFAAMSRSRHCRRIRRAVSMTGPSTLQQFGAGLERRDHRFPASVSMRTQCLSSSLRGAQATKQSILPR